MKFDRLDLRAFGCFTNVALEFNQVENGMYVVYGDNEAGKSTALRAIQYWLFGFRSRQIDFDFLHDKRDLRVGGTISLANKRLTCLRKRGDKNTLLAEEKSPLPDEALLEYLQGIDEARFTNVFGINHDQLVAGGKEVVELRGDLGATLLATATGLLRLQRIRKSIEAGKKNLFTLTGKNAEINRELAAFRDAEKRIKSDMISPKEYESLSDDIEKKTKELDELKSEQRRLQSEKERWLNINRARSVAQRKLELDQSIEGWRHVPCLTSDFQKRYDDTGRQRATVTSLIGSASEEIARLEAAIAQFPNDSHLLAIEDRFATVYKWSGNYQKNRDTRTEAGQAARVAGGEAQQFLRKLGYALDEWELYEDKLRIDDITRSKIQKHGKRHEKLQSAVETANEALAGKEAELEQAQSAVDTFPNAKDVGVLTAIIERFTAQGNPELRRDELLTERNQLVAKLSDGLKRLSLSLTLDRLNDAHVPTPETVELHRKCLADAEDRLRRATEELSGLQQGKIEIEKQMADVRLGENLPDVESLFEERGRRDQGWTNVKRAWLEGNLSTDEIATYTGGGGAETDLAEAYANHMERCDELADRLRQEARRVSDLNRLGNELDANAKKQAEALESEQRALTNFERCRDDWHQVWQPLSVIPKSPAEMRTWLEHWQKLVQFEEQRREKQIEFNDQQKTIEAEIRSLTQVLIQSGEDPAELTLLDKLSDLLVLARRRVREEEDRQTKRASLQQDVLRIKKELRTAVTQRDDAERNLRTWQTTWTELMAAINRPAETLPDEADSVLDYIREFHERMRFRRGRLKSERDLQNEEDQWLAEIRSLAQHLGESEEKAVEAPVTWVNEIHTRLKQAAENRQTKSNKESLLEEKLEQVQKCRAELDGLTQALEQLRTESNAEAVEKIPDRVQEDRDRNAAEVDVERSQKELLGLAGAEPLEQFLAAVSECQNVDIMSKTAAIEDRLNELADLIPQQANENGELKRKRTEMSERSGASGARADQEATLARLRDRCPDYAALVLAEAVLGSAIARYREKSKTDILGTASEFFRQLTLNSFERLDIDEENGKPILIGRRSSSTGSRPVTVDGMSDGTQDQLYLALRLAHLQRHVENHGPFPFIVDDILVRFDDGRALATLRCLAEISTKTQILFFTHHRHLLQMARSDEFRNRIVTLTLGETN